MASNRTTIEEKRVEQYELDLDPIRGYPELRWAGKRPLRYTQYFPAQHRESYGEPVDGWRNKIYWGDNLQVMSHLMKRFRGKVHLIYIDPPFDSKADYKKKIKLRGQTVYNNQNAFEEKQYSDIWTNDEYLQYMYERLILMRELLSETGSIYLHCDYHKSHHLRSIMEEVFGPQNFRGEIVWRRTSAHSDSGGYGSVHDTILFFSKSPNYSWNKPITEYEGWYVDRYYRYEDEDGRKFKSGDLSAAGLTGGGYDYEWKGVEGTWRCPKSTMKRMDEENRIYYTSNGTPRKKQYLDEMEGRDVQTWWDDIQPVVSWSKEKTNYPTQKPGRLLERIIKASSNPGGILFDCFMGSGTTQAVAMKHGRRFIGADINLGSVQTTTKRLISVAEELEGDQSKLAFDDDVPDQFYTGFDVYNVNHYDVFRNPTEAKDLLIEAIEIQPLQQNSVYDGEKDGRMVKIMPVDRIATREDLNPLITGFDYKAFEKRQAELPANKPVERITLVCMGHEPDLKAHLENNVDYNLDIEVVDVLRDKAELEFKREAEAQIEIKSDTLTIEQFYPMNLLQKLSLMEQDLSDWRELVESVMIDFNYDGAVLNPDIVDVPNDDELVEGSYSIPDTAGTIRVKITDLLSESLEQDIDYAGA